MIWRAAAAACLLVAGCAFDEGGIERVDASEPDAALWGDAQPPLELGADLRITDPDLGSPAGDGGACKPVCINDEAYCESGDGLRRDCSLGCNVAGDDCALFAPGTVPPDYLRQGSVEWTVRGDTSIDTTTGQLEVDGAAAGYPQGIKVFGSTDHHILLVGSLIVTSGARLRVRGERSLIIVASETIRVLGTLDCSADGPDPGPRGSVGGTGQNRGQGCGGGHPGNDPNFLLPPFTAGAGGSFGGQGGGGGGTDGPASSAPCGAIALQPLAGGSGGGGGVGGTRGGAGGGAVQLSAWSRVEVGPAGVIDCGGGGGGGAGAPPPSSGGGGGSGGAIRIEAPRVIIAGVLAANGGGGGGGAILSEAGQDGADGTASAERAAGGLGIDGLLSDGGEGGKGSGGDALEGAQGGAFESAGGGGGGAGRIVLRFATGAVATPKEITPSTGPARVQLTLEAID